MALSNKDVQILQHMIKYCQQIKSTMLYFRITKDLLDNSFMIQNAISMPILQIGELANHLSKDFTSTHSEIPWRDVVGMRNMFAHDYEKRDVETIWLTIKEDAPFLEQYCTKLLQREHQAVPVPEPAIKNKSDDRSPTR